jgi:hypothetical protein
MTQHKKNYEIQNNLILDSEIKKKLNKKDWVVK